MSAREPHEPTEPETQEKERLLGWIREEIESGRIQIPAPIPHEPPPESETNRLLEDIRSRLAGMEERERTKRNLEELGGRPVAETMHEQKTEHWFDYGLLANPLFLGAVTMITLAITFSPRASGLATWICLFFAWGLFTRMVFVLSRKKSSKWLITGLLSALAFAAFALFGWWLGHG